MIDLSRREIVNAKIEHASLFIEDHDILTFVVMLKWKGCGQGLGMYGLDSYKGGEEKVGHGPGLIAIRKIMETVGVRAWDKLPGQLCRLAIDPKDNLKPIIGNIIEDTWFDLDAFMKENRDV